MLLEKVERHRQRAVGLRLAVGFAAEPGKGVIGAGIFVNRDQRIGRQPALEQIVDFGLLPSGPSSPCARRTGGANFWLREYCARYVNPDRQIVFGHAAEQRPKFAGND